MCVCFFSLLYQFFADYNLKRYDNRELRTDAHIPRNAVIFIHLFVQNEKYK